MKPNILLVIPFKNLYPPMNGGMLRCFHLLHQLACFANVSVITFEKAGKLEEAVDRYPALASVKTYPVIEKTHVNGSLISRLVNAIKYRWIKKTLKGPADSQFLSYYTQLKKVLQSNKFDYAILVNRTTLNAVSVIRKYNPDTKIIYDAQNVDSLLAKHALLSNSLSERIYKDVCKTESSLYKSVDYLFACSNKDLVDLQALNNKALRGAVIPNGVEIFTTKADHQSSDMLLFCGTLNYQPNVEGLHWFYHKIWPLVKSKKPSAQLLVVGTGHPDRQLQTVFDGASVSLRQNVPDVKPYYEMAAVAIVPLKTGSGTRLKILESMSIGTPVVSTSIGAEGLEYENGENILIADTDTDFANAIIYLLNNKDQRQTLAQNAKALVKEKYDWNKIGSLMRQAINNIQ